jgi:uncharacterized membrane protein YfcA
MDWTVYWFQSIACFIFATAAMFSGITGAALMLPWFIMGFAFLDVPEITTQQAIAAALFLETAAFTIGIYRYARRGFIDTATVKVLAPLAVPTAILGALVAQWAPERALQVVYSVMMLGIAWLLLKGSGDRGRQHQPCPEGQAREMTDPSGNTYRFCAHGLRLQRPISGLGAFMTGLISTGVGELTSPLLILRSGFPISVAAATSIVLVAVADISAILTHFTWFVTHEGVGAIPWNLIVWGVPGMAAGAFLGSHLQGRVSERASRRFFAGLFVVISVAFLAYALFGGS